MAQIVDTLARSAGSEGASLASSLPIIIPIIAVIIALLGLLLNCYKYWKDGHNLKKASWDVLGASFSNASRRLCQALDDGCEILKTILEIVASNSRYYSPENYAFAKDNLRKVLSSFNEEYAELLSILESHDSIEFDSDAYKVIRNRLAETIKDYSCDIHDIEYITKLAFGLTVVPTDANSDILKNILDLFQSPSQNIADIIALRFDESFPRDYAGEVRDICGQLTEIARLPKRISVFASPLKTTYYALFGNPEQQYNLACLSLSLGEWAEAEKRFKKAIAGGHLEANYVYGRQLLNTGKETNGLEYLKAAADRNHEDSIMTLGKYFISSSCYDDAITYLSRLSDRRRDAKFYLARCFDMKNETLKSIELYAELVGLQNAKHDVYSAVSMYHIVELYLSSIIPEPALNSILSFYEITSNKLNCTDVTLNAYFEELIPVQIAKIYRALSMYSKSLEVNKKYAALNSPAAQCGVGWGYTFDVQCDPPLALPYFSLAANRGYPEAYIGVGFCRMIGKGENTPKSEVRIGFNYLRTATKYNLPWAFELMINVFSEGIAAMLGEGTLEDGVPYEVSLHQGFKRYFYVSSLDHKLRVSRLKKGGTDLHQLLEQASPLYWWAQTNAPAFDTLTQRAKDNLGSYGSDSYTALEPDAAPVRDIAKYPRIITVLRGRLQVNIHKKKINECENTLDDLLASVEIAHTDEISAVFLYQDGAVISSLESGTVYKTEEIKSFLQYHRESVELYS